MGMFDDLLNQVAEADREVFKKYPKLAEKIDSDHDYLNQWEAWKKDHWDENSQMTKNAVEALRQKDAEIEALKLLQGGDVNWDEMKSNVQSLVNEQLKAQKYTTADDMKGYWEKELAPRLSVKQGDRQVPITEFAQNLERGMEYTYAHTAHLPQKYAQEFASIKDAPEFTINSLFEHMRKEGIAKFEDGYNSLVAPLRAKKNEAEQAVRDEQIRQQAKEEARKEYMMKGSAQPDDNGGSAPTQTPLMARIQARNEKAAAANQTKLSTGDLGDGSSARAAYEQYLKDQAAGVKPSWPIQ